MSNEIKVGDKVRVSEKTPIEYNPHGEYSPLCVISSVVRCVVNNYAMCEPIWGDGAIQTPFLIPTRYLVKVEEEEEKEAKFKVGDRVRVKGCGYEPNLHKGDIGEILDTNDKGQCFVLFKKSQAWIYTDCLEPYTEPTEEANLQDATASGLRDLANHGVSVGDEVKRRIKAREFIETSPFDIESLKRGGKIFEDMYWDSYAADLAKEVSLKVANKYNDPKEVADYAVKVAKAVVEGLKRK